MFLLVGGLMDGWVDGSGLTQMDEARHTTLFTYAFYASLPGLVGWCESESDVTYYIAYMASALKTR